MRSYRSTTKIVAVGATAALTLAGLAVTAANAAPGRSPDRLAVSASGVEQTGRITSPKGSSTSSLAQTPDGLLKRTDSKRIPVVIKYDYDAAASYQGGVTGLRATSPSVTNRPYAAQAPSTRAYLRYVAGRESAITSDIREIVPSLAVTYSYRVVYGGVAASVPASSVKAILELPGVVAVQRDALRQPQTDSSAEFINATAAYQALKTTKNAGAGVIYGNLDSGVWPEHPSFRDKGNLSAPPGPDRACEFGDNPLTPEVDPFECNNKLIGGAPFTQSYDEAVGDDTYAGTARDSNGHGSHTASTTAGNIVNNVSVLGNDLGRVNGIAPGAWVMEYKVCGPGGCFTSDTTAAAEQAIIDGVDVINFSISGGSSPFEDPTELAFLDAYNAGVFVAASAGNSGPGAGTADHLSPWVTTVAASTQKLAYTSKLTLTADDGSTYKVKGASLTAGAGPAPVVLASDAPYSDEFCENEAPEGSFEGKIVLCARGVNARVTKGYNVLQGGAAGMVLYNKSLADVETDNHWLPTVHLADGTDMLAFVSSKTGVTAEFTDSAKDTGQGDVMAAFSSRGPAGSFIKPDITAPGVQILAGNTPTPEDVTGGPPGEYWQAIAGTSMSAPHIAGAAILVSALHPKWTPGQIKSALMTQSVTDVMKEDGVTPTDAFDDGAGRVDVGAALDAPLTISDTAARMALLAGDDQSAIDVNIASVNAPTMPGSITTERTLKNVSGKKLTVDVNTKVGPRSTLSVSPGSFTIPKGGSRTVKVKITSGAPTGTQRFGSIVFRTSAGKSHVPVAFVPQQGKVSLDQECAAPEIAKGATTTCEVTATNNGFDSYFASVTTSVNKALEITEADGAALRDGKAIEADVLAGATPGVPALEESGPIGSGYLPLDEFGVEPDPIGDEEIITYDVPEYLFNGIAYTSVSVTSNGYLVAGQADSSDLECCTLPPGPSAAPPNNILAPFWTDLDGTDTDGIYIDVLSDSETGDAWIVVEWRLNVFGTQDTRVFQTWLGTNGEQDITFNYAEAQADPNEQAFLVGAENEAGNGDMSSTLPATDLAVVSSDPEAGGSISYTVTVKGKQKGAGVVTSKMNSTGVRGTTVKRSGVTVN